MSIILGSYYQDEEFPSPIEWIPFRRVIHPDGQIRYDLISKMVLFSEWIYESNWEFDERFKKFSTTLIENAFSDVELSILNDSRERSGWNSIVFLPAFESVFFTFGGHGNYDIFVTAAKHTGLQASNNILETELTRWAANGNAFELCNPSPTLLLHYANLSHSPTWMVRNGINIGLIRKTDYAGYIFDTVTKTGIHGIRPCISLYENQFPLLLEYSSTTATIQEMPRAKTEQVPLEDRIIQNTKIHISQKQADPEPPRPIKPIYGPLPPLK